MVYTAFDRRLDDEQDLSKIMPETPGFKLKSFIEQEPIIENHRCRCIEFGIKNKYDKKKKDLKVNTDFIDHLHVTSGGITLIYRNYGMISDRDIGIEIIKEHIVYPIFKLKDECVIPYDKAVSVWDEFSESLKENHGINLEFTDFYSSKIWEQIENTQLGCMYKEKSKGASCDESSQYCNGKLKILRELGNFFEFIKSAGDERCDLNDIVPPKIGKYRSDKNGDYIAYYGEKPLNEMRFKLPIARQKKKMFSLIAMPGTGNALRILYSDKKLYSSPDMFSPPAERKANALRFELTTGCDWNRCTFCTGYKGIPYHEKTFDEFEKHLMDVKFNLGRYMEKISKVFIGGGNALSADTVKWRGVLSLLQGEIPQANRISTYGRTDSILDKGLDELQALNESGLTMIYWGIESGSDEVLDYVSKGCTSGEIIDAGKTAKEAGIKLSVMIIPGLGGRKYNKSHEEGTSKVLNEIKPDYVTPMGINVSPDTAYFENMLNDGNKPLSGREIIIQLHNIINNLEPWGGKIGCFPCDIDSVGQNPVTFNNTHFDWSGKRALLALTDMAKNNYF